MEIIFIAVAILIGVPLAMWIGIKPCDVFEDDPSMIRREMHGHLPED